MYKEQAIEKLTAELKAFKGGSKEKAISKALSDTLMMFCSQDDEFAQAIVQSDKTLSDCCANILKGVGNSISDIEAYKKAVKFYFSTADIKFQMTIDLCGDISVSKGKVISLTFDDLF